MSQMMVAVFSLLWFLYCQYVLHSLQLMVIRVTLSLIFSGQVEVVSCSYIAIGVRGGGAAAPPGLKNFRANSVFRATASCSKILNNKRYTINTVNSGHHLFFRASASYSKILNVKSIFNTVKNSRATLFSGQAQVTQNSRIIKVYPIERKISGQAQVAQKS